MIWNRGFLAVVSIFLLLYAYAAVAEGDRDAIFDSPKAPWKDTGPVGDYLSEWRLNNGAKIRIFILAGMNKEELNEVLSARLGSDGIKADIAAPFEIDLGQRKALVLPFDSSGQSGLKGALMSVHGRELGVGILCTAPVESFAAVFLECRRIASSLEIDKGLRAQAIALHESGLKIMETDPSEAVTIFQSAIKIDPSYVASYLDLSRSLLAQGQSAEMVMARLSRMLKGAPGGPEIQGMRERLRQMTRKSGF